MDHGTAGHFEFTVRGEGVRPNEELTLHYGTCCDFELSLWYGFCLCSFPHDSEEAAANHQPECECILSPLSNSDGDCSVEELRSFVAQVVLVAMTPLPGAGVNPNQAIMSQCAIAVANKMQSICGSASPRCAIRICDGDGDAALEHCNAGMRMLLDEVGGYLKEAVPSELAKNFFNDVAATAAAAAGSRKCCASK